MRVRMSGFKPDRLPTSLHRLLRMIQPLVLCTQASICIREIGLELNGALEGRGRCLTGTVTTATQTQRLVRDTEPVMSIGLSRFKLDSPFQRIDCFLVSLESL